MDEKVRRGALSLDPTLESTLPFFRELLSGRAEETLKALDARGKRQKMFEAIRALTVAGSVRAPLVLVVEDLHWIDETSEDYLAFLVDSLPGLRVLLVTTQRPGHAVRWSDRTYYRQIALAVLGEADTATLIRGVLGAEALPEGLVRRVHERAEGNPFFVEEIVRSMVERGTLTPATGGVSWTMEPSVAFPETALEIVRARIDGLEEPVKRTAQVAAVIGREFGERLLAQVVDTAALLQDYLQTLKQAEFVRETRFFPELEYIFKHAIIQDVAYQSILARRRAELHSAIGRAIEQLYADRLMDDDPDSVLKGQVNRRIAHLYLHRGEPALSLDWAARAVTLYERIGSDLGTCLGTALTYTGSVRAGLAYNLRNWEPLLRSGNSQIIAILGHELTHTLVMLRDVPSALRVGAAGLAAESALDRALEIARTGGNVLFQCWIFPRLAECALRFGDHRAAAQAVQNGFRLLTPGEDWRGLPASLHLARGQVAAGEQRWSEAEADFEMALALNRLYTCVPDEARTLVAWVRMRLARGRPDDGAGAREQLGAAAATVGATGAACDLEEVKALLGRG